MESRISLRILALTLAEADGLLQSPKLAFTQTRQASRHAVWPQRLEDDRGEAWRRLPVREAK